jgi:hypothetical protein
MTRDMNEAEAEVNSLKPKPDCRSIADAMAGNAASYVLMVPPEHRDDPTASAAEGFRDACIAYGIPIKPGDLAYYVKIVAAKVAEMLNAAGAQSEKLN